MAITNNLTNNLFYRGIFLETCRLEEYAAHHARHDCVKAVKARGLFDCILNLEKNMLSI
jgi:hypothetical protein